jgi:zinc D-Ala-D-Ala dipeptidase
MRAQPVNPDTLIAMDLFERNFPLRIDLAYARPDNLLFGERIYRSDARLWLHETLAQIVLEVARICKSRHGLRLVLYDGLRTVEAQEKMMRTKRICDNPHWLEEPRLLSSPGGGAHPRGMAVDLSLESMDGRTVDMGTPFDFMAPGSSVQENPAHRAYTSHPAEILQNRKILDNAMLEASDLLGHRLFLLPEEWWDFRLMPEVYNSYAPLHDSDLPAHMHMTETP